MIEKKIQEMEGLLHETYELVQKMYNIVVGNAEYKDASMIAQVGLLKDKVAALEEDKIKRDAKMSLLIFISGGVGTIVGGLIVNFLTK